LKIFIIICLFFGHFGFCQNYDVTYNYKFVPDSNQIENKLEHLLILKVSPEKSEYFGRKKFLFDSLRLVEKKIGIYEVKRTNPILITERIIKYKQNNKIEQILLIGSNLYKVNDNREIVWELLPEFTNVLGYKVQKAITNFAGRKWIAWFTTSIPIPDGPYKFCGLPGLILKIEDSHQYHSFIIKSLTKSSQEFIYPESETYDNLPKLNYHQYRKKYKEFRFDPVADVVGQIPDQPDQYGNMRTGLQILNEFRQREIERLKKDNNIIEIELLKN